MWELLVRFILRKRVPVLIVLAMLTGYMGWRAQEVRLQWTLPSMLPDTDSTYLAHQQYKAVFGDESMSFLFALDDDPYSDLELFTAWHTLAKEVDAIPGVDTVASITQLVKVVRDSEQKRFVLEPVVKQMPTTKQELDSLKEEVHALPFYENILYNPETGVNLFAVSVNPEIFNSSNRNIMFDAVIEKLDAFQEETGHKVVYSGLPYIRELTARLVKSEIRKFILLAALVTIVILALFFRSVPPVLVSVTVVLLGVVWSLGTMAILHYEITVLSSIIPPLIIVIGIPNSVYLINKFHAESIKHGNKILALTRIIKTIGRATFMTNLTTAVGFLAFVFTDSEVLVEFGIVASISILVLFVLSIFLIPAIFSFLPTPRKGQTKHLEVNWVSRFVEGLSHLVNTKRTKIYWVTALVVGTSLFGITKIYSTGNLVDDLPDDHTVVENLQFFESNFNGVMPLEILIDTKKPKGVTKSSTLKRIDKLQAELVKYPELSKPISIVDAMKFARQAYYGGSANQYKLISNQEKAFFKKYIENTADAGQNLSNAFVDSNNQVTRITLRMKDIGTAQMDSLFNELQPAVDSIFDPERYDVSFTGSSVVFLSGTNYLVRNLFISLLLAIVLIGGIMALLFSSFRMIAMSILTNLIPLLFTAAMMGYFSIPLKPSTILVFSIAFGIAIDDTIHFLAKYRQALLNHNWDIKAAVQESIRDTGVSMMYTSIILFFGFSVFASSQFGGTQALGILVSITLLVAMLANLVLLPSFLLTLNKRLTTKAFKEPFIEMYDEEDELDYTNLSIRENDPNVNPDNLNQ